MINDVNFSISLRLSLQRALLGNISENMRSVVVDVENKKIQLFFYFNGEISSSDEETASDVETEVIADFEEDYTIETSLTRLDYPEKIKIKSGYNVFLRKEIY